LFYFTFISECATGLTSASDSAANCNVTKNVSVSPFSQR